MLLSAQHRFAAPETEPLCNYIERPLHCYPPCMMGAGILQCLTSWWSFVLAVSGHGKNKETAAEIGCICLEQSSYWIARHSHQSTMNPTLLPHNAFKEAQHVLWFVQRTSLPVHGTMNRATQDVH
jgi:hypothetical protein